MNLARASRQGTLSQDARQWACTMAFYAVIHCIRHAAQFENSSAPPKIRPSSHAWDDWWMRVHAPVLHERYFFLRALSERCRYRLADPAVEETHAALETAVSLLGLTEAGTLALARRS